MRITLKPIISCFVLFFAFFFTTAAQTGLYTVHGTVRDSTGATIPGAIVFLGSTKSITATDNSGNFQLNGVSDGAYQVGVKMIGYEPFSENIVVNNKDISLNVSLKQDNHLLAGVTITSKTNDKKYLKEFITHFIGESENALSCIIINPQVIRFHYNNKESILTAMADSLLIIENKALGYRIKYMLQKFEYREADKITYYEGLPSFEEMAGSGEQKYHWETRREETYSGSLMRFFRGIAADKLNENDFLVFPNRGEHIQTNDDLPAPIDSLWKIKRLDNGLVYIKLKTALNVQYTRGIGQTATIKPEMANAVIDTKGSFTNNSFLFSGYWSMRGVADMLPLDYGIGTAIANKPVNNTPTQKLIAAIDSFNTAVPREKIFVQTDRLSYNNTDTIWMKAYILDAALNYTKQSGLMYAELIDDTGKVVLRQSMPVKLGICYGQMLLNDQTMPEGSYTLRAYTNWMQNQGTASFFTQRVYISAVNNNAWLVNEAHQFTKKEGNDNVHVSMQLSKPNRNKVLLQSLQLKVMNGEKVLQRDNVKTDIDGKLDLNLDLPANKTNDLRFVVETGKKDSLHRLVIPINIDRPKNIDLQFMPEGGRLVAGLPSHVGFKAVGEDGSGVNASGTVVDEQGNVAASFQSGRLGMGNFIFTPQAGKSYTARLTEPAGNNTAYPIGFIAHSGLVMHVANPADKDSLLVSIRVTDDIAKDGAGYTLVGISGGKVCYAGDLSLADGVVNGIVNKGRFGEGIAHFVAFNHERQPVAERLVFIDHHQSLHIVVTPAKSAYQPKDSVVVHIKVTDSGNQPVQGSFSMAVTDNGLVKSGASSPDIRSGMLLTGDLKGDIENPGYYFDPKNTDRYEALDNLLLTQGWVSYDWKNVFIPNYKPAFKAEQSMAVTGRISRAGSKSIGGLQVVLLSVKKPALLMDTVSDPGGNFGFHNLPRIDTANFMLQVKDKKGKMFEAVIDVDKFIPADTRDMVTHSLKPWYVNSDDTLLNYMNSSRAYNKMMDDIRFPASGRMLKQVNIKDIKTVKGSHNLNGSGNADQVLDEEDMKKLDKTPLYNLLLKQVKGFNYKVVPETVICMCPTRAYYAIYEKQIRFVMDGVDVDEFYTPHYRGSTDSLEEYDYFNYVKNFIDQYTAEDIKGIEVLYNRKYSGKYKVNYDSQLALHPVDWNAVPPTYTEIMYVEITTWSGDGFFEKRKSGNYIYRPLPVSWPQEFYHPKYRLNTPNKLADLRPTVSWEPNIITNPAGEATVWFYAKSKASSYTGIINGSDLGGSVGVAAFTIVSN